MTAAITGLSMVTSYGAPTVVVWQIFLACSARQNRVSISDIAARPYILFDLPESRRHLRLDRQRQSVAFDREGVRINLGSIGKGYAIDRAVAVLAAYWWPTSGLVHGGRSSLYALGSPPGQLGGRWEVALRNPFEPESPLGTIRLRNRALGTSGSAFQQFEIDGQIYGHIIDPRTGEPARGPASVTVLAPTAALADALSTAFYLLGPDATRDFIANHPEVGAVIVERTDSDPAIRLHVLGLTEHDFAPA